MSLFLELQSCSNLNPTNLTLKLRIINWRNMINWVWARINTHPINHLLRMIIWVLVLLGCNPLSLSKQVLLLQKKAIGPIESGPYEFPRYLSTSHSIRYFSTLNFLRFHCHLFDTFILAPLNLVLFY